MNLIIAIFLYILAVLVLIPSLVLFVECTVAILSQPSPEKDTEISSSPKFRILVPAHNEALVISQTLASLLPQVPTPETIVVIADNCNDQTAAIAQEFGVKVIERVEPEKGGKGYALDFGLTYLHSDPPDVVLIIDADCQVQEGTIEKLALMAFSHQRPVQSTYFMEKPANPKPKDIISALAFLLKNQVRLTGLARMGLPCLLTGTGMAFPWVAIRKVQVASANLVEDIQLGIDLAIAGYPPLFCPTAKVIGILPQQQQAATTQRTRWEQGHIQTLLREVPRLFKEAIKQKRFELCTLGLELGVPPLSLLVMIWGLAFSVTVLEGILAGIWLPVFIILMGGLLMMIAVIGAWFKYGRQDISGKALLAIPFYLLWKIPMYLKLLINPEKKWVRTEREPLNS